MKIRAEQLSEELMNVLNQFGANAVPLVETAIEETAKEAVQELKQTVPKRTGKYSRSWKYEIKYYRRGAWAGYCTAVVYSKKPHYRLTHLLEYGHAKRGGGRVAANPHIAKVEKAAIENYEKRLRAELEGRWMI